MPRQRTKGPSGRRILFRCPVEPCPAKKPVFKSKSAWTKHKRTHHLNVDFSQYGDTTTIVTDISSSPSSLNDSGTLSSVPPSPSASCSPNSDRFAMDLHPMDDVSPVGSPHLPPPLSHGESVENASEYHPTINGVIFFLDLWNIELTMHR